MLITFVLVYSEDCRLVEYTNNTISPSYCSMIAVLTKKGFQRYTDFNVNFASAFLTQIVLPDISLKVMQFQVTLKNIYVSDVRMPEINFEFAQNNSVIASLIGFRLQLKLAFSLSQTTYPYTSDSGTGQLDLTGLDVSVTLGVESDPECYGHVRVRYSNAKSELRQLKIKLNGKLTLIYDSILGLITESLVS